MKKREYASTKNALVFFLLLGIFFIVPISAAKDYVNPAVSNDYTNNLRLSWKTVAKATSPFPFKQLSSSVPTQQNEQILQKEYSVWYSMILVSMIMVIFFIYLNRKNIKRE